MPSKPTDSAKGNDSFVLSVKVKPRSRVSELVRASDGTWVARIQAPPVDGKANAELVALVARHFGCARAAVSIKSGAAGRMKLVKVVGVRDLIRNR